MSRIELTNVTKRWGQFYAVDNLSMVIEDNAFVTLLGPSGCGKTTTLRMIAGLETPTSGRITIDGVPVFDSQKGINVSANKRKVGFLFQNYALWPNMTVYQNISFGLTNIKEEMDEIDFNARTAARMIEILQKPQDVVRAINECVDKKKKLNLDKAYLRPGGAGSGRHRPELWSGPGPAAAVHEAFKERLIPSFDGKSQCRPSQERERADRV